jgi:hypothetical protein
MQKDVEQWRDDELVGDNERWIIMMGIGYFSAAEGIVGDNVIHVVRELVTAPELKLVLGRHAHEENIHADSLLYMISSWASTRTSARPCSSRSRPSAARTTSSPPLPLAAARSRPDRPGEQAAAREEHLRVRPVHGGHPVLRSCSAWC